MNKVKSFLLLKSLLIVQLISNI